MNLGEEKKGKKSPQKGVSKSSFQTGLGEKTSERFGRTTRKRLNFFHKRPRNVPVQDKKSSCLQGIGGKEKKKSTGRKVLILPRYKWGGEGRPSNRKNKGRGRALASLFRGNKRNHKKKKRHTGFL